MHDHDHHHHGPTPERALVVAIWLNATFLILEVVVGFASGSLALLSDAGHMVSDVGALMIALWAVRLAHRAPSPEYTFGMRRAPVLGGLLNGVSLIVIVVVIGVEAVQRMFDPTDVHSGAVLWTGIAGLAVNLGSAWYLARSRDRSVNTRGAMLHLLSDALGSVAAIVSAVAIGLFGVTIADPIASLVIALLILLGSLPLLRDAVRILLERAPDGVDARSVETVLRDHPDVTDVLDLHVWSLDDGQPVLTAILCVPCQELAAAARVTDALRRTLREQFGVEHATLECRTTAADAVRVEH